MSEKAEALRQALRDAGVEWPAPIQHFETVGSTNDVIKEAARAKAPEWSVAFADEQTAGRGRVGNRWVSPSGNLFLSVLLYPAFPSERFGLVPLAAGVSAARTARGLGAKAELKWPNDVWVGGRKLAGILVEAHAGAAGVEEMVLGFGVNIALAPSGLPSDVAATSLQEAIGPGVTTIAVAAALLRNLREACRLIAVDPGALRTAWKELAVPWWGCLIEVGTGDGAVRGVLHDLDESGGLIVETDSGRRVVVVSGEARTIRLA